VVTSHCQVKSSQVECDQVDGGRHGVDFSLKSGHVSVPKRLAGMPVCSGKRGGLMTVAWRNHYALIGPVNRRRESQWPCPRDLATIVPVLSYVWRRRMIRTTSIVVLRRRRLDVNVVVTSCRRRCRRRVIVADVFALSSSSSLLHQRYNDATTMHSRRHCLDVSIVLMSLLRYLRRCIVDVVVSSLCILLQGC